MIEQNLPQDPTPLNCQIEFKKLSDEILKLKDTPPFLNIFSFHINVDPQEVLDNLKRNSLNDLLLKPGESFSDPNPDEHSPDLNLFEGQIKPNSIILIHSDWKSRKYKSDSGKQSDHADIDKYFRAPDFEAIELKASQENNEFLENPENFDWARSIRLNIGYEDSSNRVSQVLSLYDSSFSNGEMPSITRFIFANKYVEQGYEGHNRLTRQFKNEDEAMYFVSLARTLFEKREES